MKKVVLVQSAVITVLVIVLSLVTFGSARSWQTGVAHAGSDVAAPPSTQSTTPVAPQATPTLPGWRDELPPAGLNLKQAAPSALPTPAPGETLVYFAPTDSVATATVLNLYNTDSVTHTVTLRGYYYNGVQIYFLSFNIPAYSFQRLVSDDIIASPPTSWATPIPYITSFGDSVYFASLSLPKGVKVDGYTLFNASTGLIDPNTDQGEIPLRFSTDPYTVMLPAVNR